MLSVAFCLSFTLLHAQAPAQEARIQRIEATTVDMPMGGLEPPLRLSLQKLMELYKVPALSIAVTPRTLFQAGSISKPVAAAGVLLLFEAPVSLSKSALPSAS